MEEIGSRKSHGSGVFNGNHTNPHLSFQPKNSEYYSAKINAT